MRAIFFSIHNLDRGYTGHRVLWTNGLLHRDISDTNLMFKRDPRLGVIGVLSDFDLASFEGDMDKNTERTGTLPFMACDLLTPEGSTGQIQHTYEHEAEAFFWVATIDTALYPDAISGRDLPQTDPRRVNRFVLAWIDGSISPDRLGQDKSGWLSGLRLDKYLVTTAQEICWNGGFSKMAAIWVQQRAARYYKLGSVRDEAEIYADYIEIRDEHEVSHPELRRNSLTVE